MTKPIAVIAFLCAFFVLKSEEACAQAPQKFNYQGIARESNGNPMSYKTLTVKISILPAIEATRADYIEQHVATTNEFGLYSLQIGDGTVISGDMKHVNWESGNQYVNVAIALDDKNNFVDAGTTRLLSVPYALYADRSGTAQEIAGGIKGTRTGTVSSNASHGAGDVNSLPKFTGLNVIGKSQIFDNGTSVGIGTINPAWSVHLRKPGATYMTVQSDASNATAAIRLQDSTGTSGELGLSKFGANTGGTFMGLPRKRMGAINNLTGPFVFNVGGYCIFGQTVGVSQLVRLMIDSATGNVGIGTTVSNQPTQKLDVTGQVRIRGGSPGIGKVLTSDATGTGSWQTPVLGNIIAGNNSGDVLVWNGNAWVATPKCNLFTYFYRDSDGDGFGNKFSPVQGCTALPGFVSDSTDCNDNDISVNPNTVWFQDNDGDTFGNAGITQTSCTQPPGYVANNLDCNDNNNAITTGATYYQDLDGDGFGNGAVSVFACTQPPGYVPNAFDCNDNNNAVPGTEVCNGIDDDCDGSIDEGFNVNTDPSNCGFCGNVCNLPNAVESCVAGQCAIASCNPGFFDANNFAGDGCEVNLSTHCVIGGQVFANGTTNPGAPCQVCNTAQNSFNWSNKPNGTVCPGGVCNTGTCQ